MADSGKVRDKRPPSGIEAFGAIAIMIAILVVGSAIMGFEVKVLLVMCAASNAILAFRCGYTWDEIVALYSKKIADLSGTLVIMIAIGMVIGAWMISGTAPTLVSWLSRLIDPSHILMFSFILTAIMSCLIGSSFATMGTLGIVMFSASIAEGIPSGMAAAAVICGANVGQFVSPLADVTTYVSGVNGISLYDHIKQLAAPTIISCIVSIVAFYFIGRGHSLSSDALVAVQELDQSIASTFVLNPVVIAPVILAIALCFFGINPAIVLFSSSVVAVIIAFFVQGQPIDACIAALWSGFDSQTMLSDTLITPDYADFLNRGGAASMGDSILFILVAMLAMSALELTGTFEVMQGVLFKKKLTIRPLAIVTAGCAGLFTVATGDSYTTTAMLASSLRGMYIVAGYQPRKIACLGTAWCFSIEQVLPWSFIALYSASVYGVRIGDFAPGCIFYYSMMVTTLFMTLMGIDNRRIEETHVDRE